VLAWFADQGDRIRVVEREAGPDYRVNLERIVVEELRWEPRYLREQTCKRLRELWFAPAAEQIADALGSAGDLPAHCTEEVEPVRNTIPPGAQLTPAVFPTSVPEESRKLAGVWQNMAPRDGVTHLGILPNGRTLLVRLWGVQNRTYDRNRWGSSGGPAIVTNKLSVLADGRLVWQYEAMANEGGTSETRSFVRVAPTMSMNEGDLLIGEWQNRFPAESLVKQLIFSRSKGRLYVKAVGECGAQPDPTGSRECIWSPVLLKLDQREATADWSDGSSRRAAQLSFLPDGVLKASFQIGPVNGPAQTRASEWFIYRLPD
jgi:hypothetical protein